jgi:hypothetical protein
MMMFVRAVWRLKRLVDIKQALREMDVPSTRDADLLGLAGPDFSKMTRSLFDRWVISRSGISKAAGLLSSGLCFAAQLNRA